MPILPIYLKELFPSNTDGVNPTGRYRKLYGFDLDARLSELNYRVAQFDGSDLCDERACEVIDAPFGWLDQITGHSPGLTYWVPCAREEWDAAVTPILARLQQPDPVAA